MTPPADDLPFSHDPVAAPSRPAGGDAPGVDEATVWETALHRWALLLCLAAAFLAYAIGLNAPAQYDDRHVWSMPSLHEISRRALEGEFPRRLLANLSFMFNKALTGSDPLSYRVFNVLVHGVAAWIVYRLLRTLQAAVPSRRGVGAATDAVNRIALVGAALFLLHPLATQSVTYIAQRYSSMAGLCMFLAVWCWMRWRRAGVVGEEAGGAGWAWYVGALVATWAGVFCKEFAVVTPLLVAVVEVAFVERSARRAVVRCAAWLPLAAMWIAFVMVYMWPTPAPAKAAVTVTATAMVTPATVTPVAVAETPSAVESSVVNSAAVVDSAVATASVADTSSTTAAAADDEGLGLPDWSGDSVSRSQYLAIQSQVIVRQYVPLLFVPVGLSILHEATYDSRLFANPARIYAGVLGVVLLFGVVALWRWPFVGLAIVWFFLALAPTSSLVPNFIYSAEQRLYPVLLCPALLLVALARRVPGRFWLPPLLAGLVALAGLTVARNRLWCDEVALWREAVQRSPDSARAYMALGYELERRGMWSESEAAYRRSIVLSPAYAEPHNNLGVVLMAVGRNAEAVVELRQAVRLKPTGQFWINLLTAANSAGDHEAAVAIANNAIAHQPNLPEAWYTRALAQQRLGHAAAARADYLTALERRPSYLDASFNLAVLTYEGGDTAGAYERFMAIVRTHPDHVPSLAYLATLLANNERYDGAESYLRLALRFPSTMRDQVHRRLAQVLEAKGETDSAINEYRACLAEFPRDLASHQRLALLLANRAPDEARRHAALAAEIAAANATTTDSGDGAGSVERQVPSSLNALPTTNNAGPRHFPEPTLETEAQP